MGSFKIFQFSFFFAAFFLSCTLASYDLTDQVDEVRDQIKKEMQASLFYQSYAHFFESSEQALHGFAKYFYEQSLEEKKHADKLMTYLNQRNVPVTKIATVPEFCTEFLSQPKLCKHITSDATVDISTIWSPAYMAISNAVELEKKVYDSLETIAGGTDKQLSHFIEHEFLDEQVESIKELLDYKTHLEKLKKDDKIDYTGLLMIDRWLLDKKKTEL